MQTEAARGLPSENFGVLRARRRVLNENSYIGGMLTTRVSRGGNHNIAYGSDGIIRPFGNDFITYGFAQTFDDTQGDRPLFESSLLRLRWERRTVTGLGYDAEIVRVGEAYHPAVGFVQRTGSTRMGDRISYGWLSNRDSPIYRQMVSLVGTAFLRNTDGAAESWDLGSEWTLETKSGAQMVLRGRFLYDAPPQDFSLPGGVNIPAGEYAFRRVEARYRWPWGGLVRGEINADAGTFYDGYRISMGIRPTWHVSPHLELASEYGYNHLEFERSDRRFATHVGHFRARAMFSTKLTTSAFVQYSSTLKGLIGNIRLRYNPREGNDFYLVYNHRVNSDRSRLDPVLPFTESQALVLKYTATFQSNLW